MVTPHWKQNPTVHSKPRRPGEWRIAPQPPKQPPQLLPTKTMLQDDDSHHNCSQICCKLLTYDLYTTNADFHPDYPAVNLCTTNVLQLYLPLQLPTPTQPKLFAMSNLDTFSTLRTDNLSKHLRLAKSRPFAPHQTPRWQSFST